MNIAVLSYLQDHPAYWWNWITDWEKMSASLLEKYKGNVFHTTLYHGLETFFTQAVLNSEEDFRIVYPYPTWDEQNGKYHRPRAYHEELLQKCIEAGNDNGDGTVSTVHLVEGWGGHYDRVFDNPHVPTAHWFLENCDLLLFFSCPTLTAKETQGSLPHLVKTLFRANGKEVIDLWGSYKKYGTDPIWKPDRPWKGKHYERIKKMKEPA
jgi:hypothetical protein